MDLIPRSFVGSATKTGFLPHTYHDNQKGEPPWI